MDSFNHDNQADVIMAFNSTSRYLDALLNIDNPYFERMVNQIYPPELQMNKANISDTEAPFLDLHLSVERTVFFIQFYVPFKLFHSYREVGRKPEYPGKNHLTHPQAELGLSHM